MEDRQFWYVLAITALLTVTIAWSCWAANSYYNWCLDDGGTPARCWAELLLY